jgi:amino acid adenylation domain-containing protein
MSAGQATFRLAPQQAWLFGRPGGPSVSQCVLMLDGDLEESGIESRLQQLVARHESLRTTFPTPTGALTPVAQTIHERLPFGWAVARGEEELEALLAQQSATIDLEQGPVLGAVLVERFRMLGLTIASACADVRSLLLLGRELSEAPKGQTELEPIQPADYAQWRHELASGNDPDAARARTFWSAATEGIEPRAVLFGTPAARPGAPKRIAIDLEPGTLEALAATAARCRIDPGLFVQAAWYALLGRLGGAAEVLSAELRDGRSQPDLDGAVGPFAQVVPVRVAVEAEASFLELVDRVNRARAEAIQWQDYGSSGDLSRLAQNALAGFVSLVAPAVAFASPDYAGTALELSWREQGELELSYDAGTYDGADAQQIARSFRALLAAVIVDPSARLDALPLLDRAEREPILAGCKGAELRGGAQCVHHAFEQQAESEPALPALADAAGQLSFAELNERANRLAHRLIAVGVGRDQPVGLCMQRTNAMITALLAIMKAGGAYLPLNHAHPPARLAHQLAEAGAGIVVTEEALLPQLPPLVASSTICVDRDRELLAGYPAENPPRRSDPADLAYVMYTSGSTGLPKGVAVTHGNLAGYTSAICERLGIGARERFALVSEISTDLGNTSIFPPFVRGGAIHVIDPETSMDGAALAAYVARYPIDVMKITPTHLRALLAASEGFLPRRWLVVGGEPLSWDLVERIRATGAACRILNHYGPTEATVGCCTLEVPVHRGSWPAATVPIGRPLPGARAYILDEQLEPVPYGVSGELCIAGAGVARGYVNSSEETARRFVADAVGQAGGRIYRTGDRARFLRDGTIAFLGRVDDQVKIRGFRVEPGEIEATILRHPAVREAAVVTREDGDGDFSLVAYLVASPEPTLSELRWLVGRSLPDHMMPSRFVAIDALPLTSSGKVDRRALPEPGTIKSRSADCVAPRDELEQQIAEIWCQLLRVDEVGVFDDFFSLGGHSLLATQAIMRIRRLYGNIPLGALFNSPTVAALADAIRASQGVAAR